MRCPSFFIDRKAFILYDNAVNYLKGMIQVYTGDGKGKTTAALGLAFRALGQGRRVLFIQFMKSGKNFGEVKAAQRFRKLKIFQCGRKAWVKRGEASEVDKQCAQKGLRIAQKAIEGGQYDLVILDELNIALKFGLLKVQAVKELLKNLAKNVEIVITGRYAHQEILQLADLVSEIREIKHYHQKGISARRGIEY